MGTSECQSQVNNSSLHGRHFHGKNTRLDRQPSKDCLATGDRAFSYKHDPIHSRNSQLASKTGTTALEEGCKWDKHVSDFLSTVDELGAQDRVLADQEKVKKFCGPFHHLLTQL